MTVGCERAQPVEDSTAVVVVWVGSWRSEVMELWLWVLTGRENRDRREFGGEIVTMF